MKLRFLGGLFPLLGACILVAAFKRADFYHSGFDAAGPALALFNLERSLYVPLLLFAALCAGSWSAEVRGPGLRESVAGLLGSLVVGMCLIHLAVFGLGVLHALRFSVVAAGGGILLAWRGGDALELLGRFGTELAGASRRHPFLLWGGILLSGAAAALLLAMKGLFPAGGHDYWTHYFHYYVKVVEEGSLGPNAAWYHFYYSKGGSLYFAAMLLGDPLMPSVVTFTLVLIIGFILADGVARIAGAGRALWFVAPALYFFLMSFTPGKDLFLANGGWGDFEKLHEYSSFFLLAAFWLLLRDGGETEVPPRAIARGALVMGSCAVAFMPSSIILLLALGIVAGAGLAWGRRPLARLAFCLGAALALGMVMVLAYNYAAMGLPSDLGVTTWWPHARLARIDQDGTTLDSLQLLMTRTLPHGYPDLPYPLPVFIALCLRADLLAALLYGAGLGLAAVFLVRFFRPDFPRLPREFSLLAVVSLCFLAVYVLLCLPGSREFISCFRSTGTGVGIWICLAVAATAAAAEVLLSRRLVPFLGILVLGVGVAGVYSQWNADHYAMARRGAEAFVAGRLSIADAYRRQDGLAGRMPGGALHPGTEQVLSTLPLNTRVWSFDVHSYSMRPGRPVEGVTSYIMSPHALDFYFESPEEVERTLREEHLDYFIFNADENFPIVDNHIRGNPLFAPDALARHFGLAASSGNTYLLTWKDQSREPIPPAVLEAYRKALAKAASLDLTLLKPIHDLYLDARARGTFPDPAAILRILRQGGG